MTQVPVRNVWEDNPANTNIITSNTIPLPTITKNILAPRSQSQDHASREAISNHFFRSVIKPTF